MKVQTTEYLSRGPEVDYRGSQASNRIDPPYTAALVDHLNELERMNSRLADCISTLGQFVDRIGGCIPECDSAKAGRVGGGGMVGDLNIQTDRFSELCGRLSELNDRLSKIG